MPFDNLLQHTMTVYTGTVAVDSVSGGNAKTYTVLATGVPCLINTTSSAVAERYDRHQLTVSHTVAYRQAVAIRVQDKVIGYDRDGGVVGTFVVHGVRAVPGVGGIASFAYADVEQLVE